MTNHLIDCGLERYRKVEDKMDKQKNILTYFVDQRYLVKVGDYLQGNSSKYGFSPEKGEENNVIFVDDKKRIFAIVNNSLGEVEFAKHTNPRIIRGIEGIAKSGVKN